METDDRNITSACIQKQLSLFILTPECIRTISCIVK